MVAAQSAFVASPSPTITTKAKAGVQVAHDEDVQPQLFTVDDLIRARARQFQNTPVLAYPNANSLTDYSHFTAGDLDRFADEAARKYLQAGITNLAPPAAAGSSSSVVVAVLAPSDLDYIATLLGLIRLGYTVLLLSNRLSAHAVRELINATAAQVLISTLQFASLVDQVKQAGTSTSDLQTLPVLARHDYDVAVPSGPAVTNRRKTTAADARRNVFIIHSSGSTGLPKPIFQANQSVLSNYASSFNMRAFITLPLYHNHGISSFFRSIYAGKEIFFYNAKLPLTGSNLTQVMKFVGPEIFYGVPYALKLLGESEDGIKCLQNCKIVLFGGSSCPDDLGDRLVVDHGVNLVGHYGSTETGQLMTSFRPAGDTAWNYLRVSEQLKPYLRMDKVTTGGSSDAEPVYECVVLDGWKSKVTSNSDDPPNSFRTKDLFAPHATIADAWKYLGRIDDRVTLVNGEKVLPIPIEHRIREEPAVKEVIVVGVGRQAPGLIVIPSQDSAATTTQELIATIWPAVTDANSRSEAFSQISRDMIIVLPADVDYPRTDKGTVIRAAFYKKFEAEIASLYDQQDQVVEGSLKLAKPELAKFLIQIFQDEIGIELNSNSDDFFTAGVDSLQAIRIWTVLKRSLDLGGRGKDLSQNIVFEYPNVQSLANYLHEFAAGTDVTDTASSEVEAMHELFSKYATFEPHVPGLNQPDGEYVLLTGTTGSLGAHILHQLLQLPQVKKVYALVRASGQDEAIARVRASLASRYLSFNEKDVSKVVALPSDLSRPDLGLPEDVIRQVGHDGRLTAVIHSAWAVNFNLGVRSFEQQHINGTHNLIQLCLNVNSSLPARFFFCSSISAAAGTPLPAVIAERAVAKFEHAQNMGYARAKLVTEHIVASAVQANQGLRRGRARVLRIGQIVGDSVNGVWNGSEAIPLMIRSALTIHALPALDETPSWLPVDHVATAVLELSGFINNDENEDEDEDEDEDEKDDVVYHVTNPKTFRWTEDLLPALKLAGLKFDIVDKREWIRLLRSSDQDPIKNPTVKLTNFFVNKYDNDDLGRSGLVFETFVTAGKSTTIRHANDAVTEGLVSKFVNYWVN
ncbi:hypothetical protein V1514DRAFT_327299, partial [Lipomyces japonicus]|uniref:uncharacterized protein n=1 Tax=Lipomyces japonicus TaxID=56871 RepID=UPI0034CD9FDE